MKRIVLSIFFLFLFCFASGQGTGTTINLQPFFHAQKLVAGKMYFDPQTKDSIRIDVLSFYISGIIFLFRDSIVAKPANDFHLVDLNDSNTLKIHFSFGKTIRYDKVKFNIGIDSLTNVSGALGGDLDPTKGMYWTWQSGYINFKLEGYSPKCKTRNHKFQFHIGGYQSPYAAIQTVEIVCKGNPAEIKLALDLDAMLGKINLAEENQIMSPGEKAVKLARLIPGIFRFTK